MKKITFLMAMVFAMSSMAATHHLYIDNQTGWEATALYAWADGRPDVLGGWPGIQAAGTVEKDGVTYLDFQVDATAFPANFIFNNNGGGTQLDDLYLEAGDYYLVADATSLREAGTGETVEYATYNLYVNNQTGWATFDIYAYGNLEAFGGWPGATTAPTEVKDGVTYSVYEFQVEKLAPNLNLIIHNNVGEGNEGDKRLYFTINEARDYYLTVTDAAVTEGAVGTAVDQVIVDKKGAVKFMQNGQLFIYREGKKYTILGHAL